MTTKRQGTSARGFGRLLRASLVRSQPYDLSLTAHVSRLFKDAALSERTVWRLMESEGWPTDDAIAKLSTVLLEFKHAAADSDSLRGGWDVAWRDQQRLPVGSTITIMAAAEDPKALDHRGIAAGVAFNTIVKRCNYIFLLPPYKGSSQPDLTTLSVLLSTAVVSAVNNISWEETEYTRADLGSSSEWIKAVQDRIHVFATEPSDNSWELWGRAPRYTVLYNVRRKQSDEDAFDQYGMYWTEGVSIFSSPLVENPEVVRGWEFLMTSESEKLFSFIEDKRTGILDPKDFEDWPIPGV